MNYKQTIATANQARLLSLVVVFASLMVQSILACADPFDYTNSRPRAINPQSREGVDRAEAELLLSLQQAENTYGSDDARVASVLIKLGQFYLAHGEYEKTGPPFTRALSLGSKNYEHDPARFVVSLEMVAVSYWGYGLYDKAEPLLLHGL